MADKPPAICLVSFPHKFAGAERVPCDLGCGALCYEHPENIANTRASGGYVICVFCAIEMKQRYGINFDLDRQLWHGAERKVEVAGDINQLLLDLIEGK